MSPPLYVNVQHTPRGRQASQHIAATLNHASEMVKSDAGWDSLRERCFDAILDECRTGIRRTLSGRMPTTRSFPPPHRIPFR